MQRAIVIVMDGCGAGEAPDSTAFNDFDHPNTLKHVWTSCGGLNTPFLTDAGLWAVANVEDAMPSGKIGAHYGRLQERSQGKDSVTGHWEMMGIVTEVPFPTYPHGFPSELIEAFEARAKLKVLGNKPASGTEIIEELGPEHERTGRPIVYTSADSVFQIAAHELVIPVNRLYELCQIAREICMLPNNLERIIARPFVGKAGAYNRTGNRRDFPLDPPRNFIDDFSEQFGPVYGIGVVPELFNHRGFLSVVRSRNNAEHRQELLRALDSDRPFIFANFEDFDMLYGHRNNPTGFGHALEELDQFLLKLWNMLGQHDLVILTADHGNDPTSKSTDHSREYVPFCCLSRGFQLKCIGDIVGMAQISVAVKQWLGMTTSV